MFSTLNTYTLRYYNRVHGIRHVHTHTTLAVFTMTLNPFSHCAVGSISPLLGLGQNFVTASASRVWQSDTKWLLRLSHKTNMHFHLVSWDIHSWNPATMLWKHQSQRKATERCSSWQSQLESQPTASNKQQTCEQVSFRWLQPPTVKSPLTSEPPQQVPCRNHRFMSKVSDCYFKPLILGWFAKQQYMTGTDVEWRSGPWRPCSSPESRGNLPVTKKVEVFKILRPRS